MKDLTNLEKQTNWLLRQIKKKLSPARYNHSLSVAFTAQLLAEDNSEDSKLAFLAGLAHDYARELTPKQLLNIVKKHQINLSDFEKNNPILLHGLAAELLLKNKFKNLPACFFKAIRHHTLGWPVMTNLEKIIYVADYIAETRNFPEAQKTAKALNSSLDKAVFYKAKFMLQYAKRKNWIISPIISEVIKKYKS